MRSALSYMILDVLRVKRPFSGIVYSGHRHEYHMGQWVTGIASILCSFLSDRRLRNQRLSAAQELEYR
jgi:hypothetical protein